MEAGRECSGRNKEVADEQWGYVCIMLRSEGSATLDQLLAVAEEVFDLPPEHAAALARGALDGEETMVAILPPCPARALLAAAEAWAAEHGAALSFGLTTVSDASRPAAGRAGRAGLPHPGVDPFAAWRRCLRQPCSA